ncbi:hypothetical protein HOY82DRAFT_630642 [Tuber indicum]|nr:hypothetical protein HOY82DRAFT_630642 [Tuber indicum]
MFCDESSSYLQRLMEEPSKNHEDCEHSHVAFCGGVDHRTDTNKINPTKDDFGITFADGKHNAPVQSPYTASQLRNFSPTLPRIIPRPSNAGGMSFSTDGNKKLKSELIAIMDLHGGGVRAIIKDKMTAFLKT